MYPGSLPLIFNGSVPGHEKMFNVRRCAMYTGVRLAGSTVLQTSICVNHAKTKLQSYVNRIERRDIENFYSNNWIVDFWI